ncbi:PTS sugar transporter subunit IIA [Anaerorhabdus sp.]|uniref:PTS sugar transporter subunit IIA n=1 Tax=Anaerorhabdus sp. TaxID=1872524 RepID=UPI002FCBD30E
MSNLLNDMYFDENLVVIDLEATDSKDALTKLATVLKEKDVVKDSFTTAILKRETVYPTGLMCEELAVAIPHTDAEHVNKQAIAVAILKEPVQFVQMGTENDLVDVKIMFMMAIKEPHKQMDFLQALMFAFMSKDKLTMLSNCKTTHEAAECFKGFFE